MNFVIAWIIWKFVGNLTNNYQFLNPLQSLKSLCWTQSCPFSCWSKSKIQLATASFCDYVCNFSFRRYLWNHINEEKRIALNLSIRELSSFQFAAHQLVDPFKGLNSFVCYKYQIKLLGASLHPVLELISHCSQPFWWGVPHMTSGMKKGIGQIQITKLWCFHGLAQDSAWFLWIEASQRTTQFLAAMEGPPMGP